MADELRFAMSVTPIQDNLGGGAGETSFKSIDTRAAEIGNSGTLSYGGNQPTNGSENAWDADGILQCITSGGASGNLNIPCTGSPDGLWFKNTGFAYDAAKKGNVGTETSTTTIELYCASTASASSDFCFLSPGASIFVPNPASSYYSINDDEDGDPVAVEFVIFT